MSHHQQPLASPFGSRTTAQQALSGADLTGKVATVTGGYSGIGLETTRVLAAAGASVVVPARTPDKATAALAGLSGVTIERMDLLTPASTNKLDIRLFHPLRRQLEVAEVFWKAVLSSLQPYSKMPHCKIVST